MTVQAKAKRHEATALGEPADGGEAQFASETRT
jgi:hypothetical protein